MKISVIITTHNRVVLLREAIESVLHQEPCEADLELIVVDDASTDDTPTVAMSYPSVRYVWARQGTCSGSRNVGIEHARGEWIAFLDDDDVWLPHKLKQCCALIAAQPEARFVFSAAVICDYHLRRGALWSGPALRDSDAYNAFLNDIPSPSTVIVHRDVFDGVGVFDTSVPRAEDRDLWFRLLLKGFAVAAVTEPLVLYRTREKENGGIIYNSFMDTMKVFQRYFAPGTARRPPWKRRQQVLWRLRGWYAHQMMAAAAQARKDENGVQAVDYRRIAFAISPFHTSKAVVRQAMKAL